MAQGSDGKKDSVSQEMSNAAENYWDYVPAMLSSALRSNRDVDEYVKRYRGLIDFGIAPAQLAEIKSDLPELPKGNCDLSLLFISDWIKHFINRVTKSDEREHLLLKEKRLNLEIKQIVLRIEKLQIDRKKKLDSLFDFSEYRGRVYKQLIQQLPLVDQIKFDSMLKNEASSRGRYFAVEERRTFASERQWVAQQDRKIEALIGMVEDRDQRSVLAGIFQEMNNLLNERLNLRRQLDLCKERRFDLEEEIAAIPIETITAKLSQKILRMKSVIAEEIERVGGETGTFRKANDLVIDLNEVNDEVTRIIEFDREIFANNYTNKFGRPSILLVPGKGDGLYDHVDNLLIVPMLPNFNLGESLASAFISYRLYHDENKKFIRSYGRLPINSNIGMGYTLKTQLVKSYSKWITMEYDGYRVLDKDERIWFARFCAPKRTEFYYPADLLRGGLHGEIYDDLVDRINRTIKDGTIQPKDLWYASVISCKKGEYEKAEQLIKTLLKKSTDYIFAYFNLGILYLKLYKDELAIDAFTTFNSKNPPKWWAGVAQEQIVVLKKDKKKKKA